MVMRIIQGWHDDGLYTSDLATVAEKNLTGCSPFDSQRIQSQARLSPHAAVQETISMIDRYSPARFLGRPQLLMRVKCPHSGKDLAYFPTVPFQHHLQQKGAPP